jgi:hypothetical protein
LIWSSKEERKEKHKENTMKQFLAVLMLLGLLLTACEAELPPQVEATLPAIETPTPQPSPAPTLTPSASNLGYNPSHPAVDFILNQAHLVRYDQDKLVCVSRGGLNGVNRSDLKEGHVLGPYQGDFQWTSEDGSASGHVLFKYENGSFVIIRAESWERFPPTGRLSLTFEEAMQMLQRGQIIYLEGRPRGVPECD